MSENYEPLRLELSDGTEIEATPDNTSLFMFVGRLACYNHVFIVMNEEESQGAYIFSNSNIFTPIGNHILQHDYPLHTNLREVADCDVDAFNRMVHQEATRDLSDGVPSEWLE